MLLSLLLVRIRLGSYAMKSLHLHLEWDSGVLSND